MTQLTLREAAREARVGKSSISRAVASGRISATRTEDGRLLFDPAELFRAFPPKPAPAPEDGSPGRPGAAPMGQTGPTQALLEQRVADLLDRLAEMKEARDDARRERDEWRDQAKAANNRPLMLQAPAGAPRWRWPFSRKSA